MFKLMFKLNKKNSCIDFVARVLFIYNNKNNNYIDIDDHVDDQIAKTNVVNFDIYNLLIAKTNDD